MTTRGQGDVFSHGIEFESIKSHRRRAQFPLHRPPHYVVDHNARIKLYYYPLRFVMIFVSDDDKERPIVKRVVL